jgi:hypothetical protein
MKDDSRSRFTAAKRDKSEGSINLRQQPWGTALRYPKLSSGFFRWHRFLVEPFALAVTMLLNTIRAKVARRIRVVSLLIPGLRPVLTVHTEMPHVISREFSIIGFSHGITSMLVMLFRSR